MMWPDRFWAKVDASGDCWEWTAAKRAGGYGQTYTPTGKYRPAHRVAYELLVGPIPSGLELDHLCRNRACVNPDHLEPVTGAENRRRSPIPKPTPIWAVKRGNDHYSRQRTRCLNGHEYPPAVLAAPRRKCPTCRASLDARRRRPLLFAVAG